MKSAGLAAAWLAAVPAATAGLEAVEPGVVILQLRRDGAAERLRFPAGDRIVAVNGEPVRSVGELKKVLARPANRRRIAVDRGRRTLSLVIDR